MLNQCFSRFRVIKCIKWLVAAFFIFLFAYPVGYFVLEPKGNIDLPRSENHDDKGVGAYIINLDRSKERYAYIKDSVYMLGLPVERISAVDGNKLSEQEFAQRVDIPAFKTFVRPNVSRGEIGCYLSHVKAWQSFLDSNLEFAIIFEDDVSFSPPRLKTTIDELVKNRQLWDVVTFDISGKGNPVVIKKLANGQDLVLYLSKVICSGAYMINRKAAERFLQKALPIKMSVDYYFTRAWEFDIKFTGIENPRLVHQTFGVSEIGSRGQKFGPNFLTNIKYQIFSFQSKLIRLFYNLKLYFAIVN